MPVLITLNQIRKNKPCKNGWERLFKAQGKTSPDNVPFPITDVLDSNGIDDAHWCLDCLKGYDREKYHYLADIAESVLHVFEKAYPDDMRPRRSIQDMRDFADGKISKKRMNATRNATETILWAAVMDDEWDAAIDAVWATTWDTTWDAATAARRAAEGGGGAERQKQEYMFRKWFG